MGKTTTIEWELITPRMAAAWLETNTHNRNLNQRRVDAFVRDISEGNWDEDANSIKLNEAGSIVDGQHRLWAIVEADIPCRCLVMRNIKPATIRRVDTGKSRSLADFLSMDGIPSATAMASAVNHLMTYRAFGRFGVHSGRNYVSPTMDEALTFYDTQTGLYETLNLCNGVRQALGGGSIWCAIFYILDRIDTDDAHAFLKAVEIGADLSTDSPIFCLRRRLLENKISHRKFGPAEYSALVIKSWNLWRQGVPVTRLAWRAGGASPEVYPVPE
jgi:hypothetical protein